MNISNQTLNFIVEPPNYRPPIRNRPQNHNRAQNHNRPQNLASNEFNLSRWD